VLTTLDFSVRSSLLPRSRFLDKLCAAETWCHPPHVSAAQEKGPEEIPGLRHFGLRHFG
jgi:hypothetical protein